MFGLLTAALGVLAALVVAELLLWVWNPLPSRVRDGRISLRSNYDLTYELHPPIAGLDEVVHYTSNSLGLRGPDPPADWRGHVTVLAVGGSTTECSLLSNERTWPAVLQRDLSGRWDNAWVNNAGIDGCSTHAHAILLRDYLVGLAPDVILFYVGINDRGKTRFENETGFLRDARLLHRLAKSSELANLLNNLWERWRARRVGLQHGVGGGDAVRLSPEEEAEELRLYREALPAFRVRVEELVRTCRQHAILPVLMTQPVNASPSSVTWRGMQVYNEELLRIGVDGGIDVIDVAARLPRDPGLYYDAMHYTIDGAREVARVVNEGLVPILERTFGDRLRAAREAEEEAEKVSGTVPSRNGS